MNNGFGFGFGFMRRGGSSASGGGGSGPQPYSGSFIELNSDGGSAGSDLLFQDANTGYWIGTPTARYDNFADCLTNLTAGDAIVVTKADNYGNITINKECQLYAAEAIASHGFIETAGVQMPKFGNMVISADCEIAGVFLSPTGAGLDITSATVTASRCNFWVNGVAGIRLNGTEPKVFSYANVFYTQGSTGRCFHVLTADAQLVSRCDTASTFTTNAVAAVDRTGYEGATVDVQGMIALGDFANGGAFEQGTLDSWGDTDYDVTTDTSAPGMSSTTGVVLADYMTLISGGGTVFYPQSEAVYDDYPSGTAVAFTNDGRTRAQDYAGALESIGFQNVFDTDTTGFESEIFSGSTALAIRASAYLSIIGAGEAIMWATAANYDPSAQTRIAMYANMKSDAAGGGEQNTAFWLSVNDSGTLSDDGYRVELGRTLLTITRYNAGVASTVYSDATYAMNTAIRTCYFHVMINDDGVHFRFYARGAPPPIVDTHADRHTVIKRAGFGIRATGSGGTPRIYNGTLA